MAETTGVLLMAYGTPASLADVEAYYTHIRRGRPPTPELLLELVDRYRAIGGSSPLLAITRAQARGLEQLLNRGADRAFRVELGMKHAQPFIEEGVGSLADAGIGRAVGLVLAPHYSALSVGEYIERVRAAAAGRGGPEFRFVEQWHLAPGYVALLADRVRRALESFPADERHGVHVLFSAHSLPLRIIASGDPYPVQLEETAAAVAELAAVDNWSVAWQSAGRTPEPWLGPDVRDVMRELAAAGGTGVVICPAGFVSDHLEVLYDLDVECRRVGDELGLPFARTALPNAAPEFLAVLAQVVRASLETVVAAG
jgi:protoporphyrin/coproporphyrin ferrochelatase